MDALLYEMKGDREELEDQCTRLRGLVCQCFDGPELWMRLREFAGIDKKANGLRYCQVCRKFTPRRHTKHGLECKISTSFFYRHEDD